jgi:hypothetical protein
MGLRCECGAPKSHGSKRCRPCSIPLRAKRRRGKARQRTATIDLTERRCRCGGLKSWASVLCASCRATEGRLYTRTLNGRQSPEYAAFQSIKQRCQNPRNPEYANYGGRGISVAPEWLANYDTFRSDIGTRPSSLHTLDRINNNGNYEPGNVRWATMAEQQLNRRVCLGIRRVRSDGTEEAISLLQAASELAISYSAFRTYLVRAGVLRPEPRQFRKKRHASA